MSEQTKTEIIAEEYAHFRYCGIPRNRTLILLADAFGVSETAIRKSLYRHEEMRVAS